MGGQHRRRGSLAIAVLAVAFAFASCSSDGDSTTTQTPSTPVAPAGSAPGTPAPAGSSGTAPATAAAMSLSSSAFTDGGTIPLVHACTNQGGENSSPPLAWSGVPDGTATLVLVVHDPDAPREGGFTHLVAALPADDGSLPAGAGASGGPMGAWIGPCPPSGEHHYVFTLYAFGPDVALTDAPDKAAVDAVADQALATATLTGRFAHQG